MRVWRPSVSYRKKTGHPDLIAAFGILREQMSDPELSEHSSISTVLIDLRPPCSLKIVNGVREPRKTTLNLLVQNFESGSLCLH